MRNVFRRHIALPTDHGAWVFIASPLLIGLFAGGRWSLASLLVILGALSAFLARQPVSIAIKVISGRRGQHDLPAAILWTALYAGLGLAAAAWLSQMGFAYLLLLAVPGLPVFAWHLWLVARRAERRQPGVEIVATGVLSLAAPAAFWAGRGLPDPAGWWLFVLCWLQSAASIVYAYARLEQRELKVVPDTAGKIRLAARALAYTSFNLLSVLAGSLLGWLPGWIFLPYAIQWSETVWGTLHPAVRVRPAVIGFRQLIVSALFTILFVLLWQVQ